MRTIDQPALQAERDCKSLVAESVFMGDDFGEGVAIGGKSQPTAHSRVVLRNRIRDAQIEVLQAAVEEIRRKCRETPAWAHGYNSAVTTLELQIQRLVAGV